MLKDDVGVVVVVAGAGVSVEAATRSQVMHVTNKASSTTAASCAAGSNPRGNSTRKSLPSLEMPHKTNSDHSCGPTGMSLFSSCTLSWTATRQVE